MILKDEEYLKRNILAVFYKHMSEHLNCSYYRFVGQQEFETLLKNNIIYFTNPVEWKKANTGDEKETYFEDWFFDRSNIEKAYNIIKKKVKEREKQYCSHQSIMAVFSNFLGAVTLLQQNSFCYCVTDTFANNRMIEEYHSKYGRNIIIKFKNDFYRKMSILNKGDFAPHGTYLYADVMPMVYVKDFDEFIEKYILGSYSSNEVAKNAFDYGAFLKHIDYAYEHETRIKLRMHLEEQYNLLILANKFYYDNWIIQDEKEIMEKSMEFIMENKVRLNSIFFDVQDKIKEVGGKECFELRLNDISSKDIVDCIILHQNASIEEKEYVYKLANHQRISVKEWDFDRLI